MKSCSNTQNVITKAIVLLLVIIIVPSVYVFAGPSAPGGDAGAPIDGGISLLVAAGIGYGAKKVHAARKKTKRTGENCTL